MVRVGNGSSNEPALLEKTPAGGVLDPHVREMSDAATSPDSPWDDVPPADTAAGSGPGSGVAVDPDADVRSGATTEPEPDPGACAAAGVDREVDAAPGAATGTGTDPGAAPRRGAASSGRGAGAVVCNAHFAKPSTFPKNPSGCGAPT